MSLPWLNEGFVQINGKQLEYACYGPVPDEAPTIILLHEGLGVADCGVIFLNSWLRPQVWVCLFIRALAMVNLTGSNCRVHSIT